MAIFTMRSENREITPGSKITGAKVPMQNEPRYLRKTKKPSLAEWARSVVRDEMGCGFWFRFDRKPLERFKQGSDMIYFMYYKASSRTSTLGR